jgi:hypothetical protein
MREKIKDILTSAHFVIALVLFLMIISGNFIMLTKWHRMESGNEVLKTHQIDDNTAAIKLLNVKKMDEAKKLHEFDLELERLDSKNHEFELKLSSLHTTMNNTINYQQVLRTEVKNNAEEKISIKYFWSIVNNVLIRLRWLEDHHNR